MELSEPLGFLVALIILVITIVFVILKAKYQSKIRICEMEKYYSDLGLSVDELPDPNHIELLSSLRGGTKPVATLKKQIQNGTMYVYQSILTFNTLLGRSYNAIALNQTVAVVSPNLRLPRFTISPSWKRLDQMKSKRLKEFDKTEEFVDHKRDVECVQLGIDEEYENMHFIQSNDRKRFMTYITPRHIRELKVMDTQYEIRCNKSCFSIDLPMWIRPGENYLQKVVADAENIYRILST